MHFRRAAMVLVTSGAVLALGAPAATAAPSTAGKSGAAPKASFINAVGVVVIDKRNSRIGYIPAVYRCTGTGSLWASVKQVTNRSRDQRLLEEGSSAIARAWSDSHRNAVTCDGKVRFKVFTVDQEEPYFTENGPTGEKSDIYGPLKKGWGYVQLCLFDDFNTEIPLSDMELRRVVKPHHGH